MRSFLDLRFHLMFGSIVAGVSLICVAWPMARPSAVETAQSAVTQPQTVGNVTKVLDKDWSEVKDILSARCIGCHRSGTDQPDLTNYHAIIAAKTEDGEPLVVAGVPEDSWLWEMATLKHASSSGAICGVASSTPSDDESSWLDDIQLTSIKRWIRKGAHEYD